MDEIIKNKNVFIQYDPNTFKNFSSLLFNIDYISKEGLIKSEIVGRGKAYEIEFEGNRFILKHYIRGGFISKISYDKYFFDAIASSRAVKEYNFLNNLYLKGLPVPKPAALQVVINKFTYTADLITCKINNEGTLYDFVQTGKMNSNLWSNLENTLQKFYDENVYHSDLNTKNIIIDKASKFYFLDFDNSYFFYKNKLFKKSVIRLGRSLSKLGNYNNELEKFIKNFN